MEERVRKLEYKLFKMGKIMRKLKNKRCRYCGTKHNVTMWVPAGNICSHCKKALDKIIKYKTGIPMPRVTKEHHQKVDNSNSNQKITAFKEIIEEVMEDNRINEDRGNYYGN